MPDVEEVIDAELNYKFACSEYDIRKFVASALEGLKLDAMDGIGSELLAAVDEAEKASGRTLDADNDKGWQVGPRVGRDGCRENLTWCKAGKAREDAG